MNENMPNVVRPSLNLDNIPDEIKFSPERYQRILRYIDEQVYSPDFKEESSGYDELTDSEKEVVTKWANLINARAKTLAPHITSCLLRLLDPNIELLEYRLSDGTMLYKEIRILLKVLIV